MADALADINKIMDCPRLLVEPQAILGPVHRRLHDRWRVRQLRAPSSPRPKRSSFRPIPNVRKASTSRAWAAAERASTTFEKRYDQAFRNLRLPSARKTLATVFFMLDITDKTPQKEIDRRIQHYQ